MNLDRSLGPRSFRRGVALLLAAAAFLMAVPVLTAGPLAYDDQALLHGSEGGALDRGLLSFFTDTYYYAYLPFYGLSYRLDGALFGGSPVGFHLANALWHAAAGYALFCVLGLLLADRVAALLGALLFVLHPLHVESVAWIAGRKEVLSAFFLFLAWLFHLKREEGAAGAGVGALLCFVVACFSKASAIVLPGFLLAAALLLPRYAGARRAAALRTLPLFLVAALAALVHLGVAADQGVVVETASLPARLGSGLAAWGRYFVQAVLPFDLSIDYPEARVESLGAAWKGVVTLALAVAALFALHRRAPVVSFGLAVFLIGLAPFNDVFPATTIFRADRYAYLSLAGAAAVAGGIVLRRRAAALPLALLAAVYLVVSMASASRFESDETLWSRTIENRPRSALAHINRGLDRRWRARAAAPPDPALLDEAIADLREGRERAERAEHEAKALRGLV
ncbi:MAG: hypothetical protein ACE5JG_09690, partial [Planctomycetota bacterium]